MNLVLLILFLGIMAGIILSSVSNKYAFPPAIKKGKKSQNEMEDFLNQVNFPISSRDLVRHAGQHGADWLDLSLLESLPDHIYQTKNEILTQFDDF